MLLLIFYSIAYWLELWLDKRDTFSSTNKQKRVNTKRRISALYHGLSICKEHLAYIAKPHINTHPSSWQHALRKEYKEPCWTQNGLFNLLITEHIFPTKHTRTNRQIYLEKKTKCVDLSGENFWLLSMMSIRPQRLHGCSCGAVCDWSYHQPYVL